LNCYGLRDRLHCYAKTIRSCRAIDVTPIVAAEVSSAVGFAPMAVKTAVGYVSQAYAMAQACCVARCVSRAASASRSAGAVPAEACFRPDCYRRGHSGSRVNCPRRPGQSSMGTSASYGLPVYAPLESGFASRPCLRFADHGLPSAGRSIPRSMRASVQRVQCRSRCCSNVPRACRTCSSRRDHAVVRCGPQH
jgi:hypothetical protein